MSQSAAFHRVKRGKLRDEMTQIISPLIINNITASN